MTSRPDAGFSLIEVLATLAVLALGLTLVALHGPADHRRLDLGAAAADLAETLRAARARAIAQGRPEGVLVDTAGRQVIAAGIPRPLPEGIDVALFDLAGRSDGTRLLLGFAPDGSSSGGAVELAAGGRRLRVAAGWLDGRVRVTDAR